MQETKQTQVQLLDQEDPLEEEMATYSSILAWRIPWTEKLAGLQSMGHKELDTTEHVTPPQAEEFAGAPHKTQDSGLCLLLLLSC